MVGLNQATCIIVIKLLLNPQHTKYMNQVRYSLTRFYHCNK